MPNKELFGIEKRERRSDSEGNGSFTGATIFHMATLTGCTKSWCPSHLHSRRGNVVHLIIINYSPDSGVQ